MTRTTMTAAKALAEARRRWGKEAAVQDDGPKCASNPDQRAAAQATLRALPDHKSRTPEQHAEAKRLLSATMRYRYSVGKVLDLCGFGAFMIEAQGDTWAEAFATADRKQAEFDAKYAPKKKAAGARRRRSSATA